MARPREFDINSALDAALDVFWARGYEAASMQELMTAMGISKSSLYDTFGNKRELYLQAIDRYANDRAQDHEKAFLSAPSARAAIEGSIWQIVENSAKPEAMQGCFAMNCAVEMGQDDPQAADRIQATFRRYQRNYEIMISRAQQAGEIPEDKDPCVLARFLTSSSYGLQVMARGDPDPAVLGDVARTILAALD